jgi:hypothetical protein
MKRKNKSLITWGNSTVVVLICLIIIIGSVSIVLIQKSFSSLTASASDKFQGTLESQKEETYQKFYQISYDAAEKKYHVENNVTISVENVEKENELEVLQVSDVEYITSEEISTRCTAIRGNGTYTVDLNRAEYLIDNERQYVLVRVPNPHLKMVGLDDKYENYGFEENGMFNGNIKEGVDLARKDLQTAEVQIQEKLATTQSYYEYAQNSARLMISNIVKNLNPEIPNLTVDVEFVD